MVAICSACQPSLPVMEELVEFSCGDGRVRNDLEATEEGFEECDDGNIDDRDGCTNSCRLARCGDGITRRDKVLGQEGYESCDDGNDNNQDPCTVYCEAPRCGDGLIDEANEACDDGNTSDFDTCLSNCARARCGDGIVHSGEACDDGNTIETDDCLNDCSIARCGDGVVQPGEGCDDGNDEQTDSCLTSCQEARCGDGFLRQDQDDSTGEACDDGNATNEDECTNSCTLARCGDGIIRADLTEDHTGFEWCDDGNTEPMDNCTTECKIDDHGDSFEHATRLTSSGARGDIQSPQDIDRFRWVATLAGTYRFRVTTLPTRDGGQARQEVMLSMHDAAGERLDVRNTFIEFDIYYVELEVTLEENEIIYLGIRTARGGPTGRYQIVVQTTCGNGVVEPHEACDPLAPAMSAFSCRSDCNWRRSLANADATTCYNQEGALWCTGANNRLLLGLGRDGLTECARSGGEAPISCARRPLRIQDQTMGLTSMTLGQETLCITDDQGDLYCAGENHHQLGVDARYERNCPNPNPFHRRCIAQLRPVHHNRLGSINGIAAVNRALFAVKQGQIFSWGQEAYGLLGHNSPNRRLQHDQATPTLIAMPDPNDPVLYVEGTAFSLTACAMTEGRSLYCWGLNNFGQTGRQPEADEALCPFNWLGTPIPHECDRSPRRVEGLEPVLDFAVGWRHACAVTEQGHVYCWGNHEHGQLGLPYDQVGECNARIQADRARDRAPRAWCNATPQRVNLNDVMDIGAGTWNTCAVVKSGRVFCWGWGNYFRAAGIGARRDAQAPRMLGRVNDAVEVSVGSHVTCIRHRDNRVSCWGRNSSGETGANTLDEALAHPRLIEFR